MVLDEKIAFDERRIKQNDGKVANRITALCDG